jgi:hypothetical protein
LKYNDAYILTHHSKKNTTAFWLEISMSRINAGSYTSKGHCLNCTVLWTMVSIKRNKMRRPRRAAAQAMEKPHGSPVRGTGRQGNKQGASPDITTSTKAGKSCSSILGSSYS